MRHNKPCTLKASQVVKLFAGVALIPRSKDKLVSWSDLPGVAGLSHHEIRKKEAQLTAKLLLITALLPLSSFVFFSMTVANAEPFNAITCALRSTILIALCHSYSQQTTAVHRGVTGNAFVGICSQALSFLLSVVRKPTLV